MSDTYFLEKLNCAYCGKENDFDEGENFCPYPGIAYTFEDGAEFVCRFCKNKNKVVMDFKTTKTKERKS